MSDVTDGDRIKTRDILKAWVIDNPDVPPTPPAAQVALVELLAQALADERAKAREPFLALADLLDNWDDHRGLWSRQSIAARIHKAAEEQQ